MVCQKYEIAFGFEQEHQNQLFLAADATRKVVKQTVGENVLLFMTKGNFRIVGQTYDLEIFWLADPFLFLFFRNI